MTTNGQMTKSGKITVIEYKSKSIPFKKNITFNRTQVQVTNNRYKSLKHEKEWHRGNCGMASKDNTLKIGETALKQWIENSV